MTRGHALLLICLLPLANLRAQGGGPPVGCYVASPALTYSATGVPERGDSTWAAVRLDSGGRARRPLRPVLGDNRSRWRFESDTLHLLVSDGLAGWRLSMIATRDGWTGIGEYLSDAAGVGWVPPRIHFTLQRIRCAGPA